MDCLQAVFPSPSSRASREMLRSPALARLAHKAPVMQAMNKRCTSVNLVSLWHFEPFSSAEASSLASSSLAVGRGKPLNENRGERWFHVD